MRTDTHLTQTGSEVQDILNRVEALGPATQEEDGLMSSRDKRGLDEKMQDRPMTNWEIEAILTLNED